MAWYNGGLYEGLGVDRVATILAELCYAVNERQAAVACPLTSWINNGGPVGAYPTAADFDGMRVHRLYEVFDQLHLTLEDLATNTSYLDGFFVNPYDGEPWVLSDFITAMGYGTDWIPVDPSGQVPHTNTAIYNQFRLGIELLKYFSHDIVTDLTQQLGKYQDWTEGNASSRPTQEDSWDTAVAALAPNTPFLGLSPVFNCLNRRQGKISSYNTSLRTRRTLRYTYAAPAGVVVKGFLYFKVDTLGSNTDAQGDMDVSDGTTTQTLTGLLPSALPRTIKFEQPASLFTGSTFDFTLSMVNLPASHPFPSVETYSSEIDVNIPRSGSSWERIGNVLTELQVGTDLTYG